MGDSAFPARQLRRCQSSPTRGEGAAAAQRPRSLLSVLGSLTSLEVLTLTHNEIQGAVGKELTVACNGLPRLKRLDLSRNHIPPAAMRELLGSIPERVQVSGSD